MSTAPPKPKPNRQRTAALPEEPVNDLERRRELGQFFTPPKVASFVCELLEIIHGNRLLASARIIDPACGEGVFLRAAHDLAGLPARNLFGADIDPTLAVGWQQDPLLREANLVVANGLLDHPQAGIAEGTFDLVIGNPPFGGKGLRDLIRLLEAPPENAYRPQTRFVFETSYLRDEPPPRQPLPAEERAELERLLRTLSQYSCWRLETEQEAEEAVAANLDDLPPELFGADALFDRRLPTAGDYERAAQLIARWPAERPLDASRPEVRDAIRRLSGTPTEVLFTERFVRLAKRGALIAVIVPESIAASDRLGAFRLWLLGRMDLLACVSLPQKVFTGVGANARTYIVFARRRSQDRINGWYSPDRVDDLPEHDRPVFLAGPRPGATGFSTESYLACVLADARTGREEFWPEAK